MRHERRDAGFTLLETLVAFLILAFVLTAAYRSVSASTQAVERADRRFVALTIAEGALARLGAETALRPGETRITEGPWTATITVEEPTRRGTAWEDLGQSPLTVTVEVSRAGSGRELTLETLRIGGT